MNTDDFLGLIKVAKLQNVYSFMHIDLQRCLREMCDEYPYYSYEYIQGFLKAVQKIKELI